MLQVDEQDIVAPLLGYSPFDRFYHELRSEIRGAPMFFIDPELWADGCNSLVRRCAWLRFKRPMETLEDAYTVAHELSRTLLDQEGFPTLVADRTVPEEQHRIAAMLNGILDIEIDRRLHAVGFSGESLVTIDSFRVSLISSGDFDSQSAADVAALVQQTGYDHPDKVRRFFQVVLPDIQTSHPVQMAIVEGRQSSNMPAARAY
jgi:hypothetical protein